MSNAPAAAGATAAPAEKPKLENVPKDFRDRALSGRVPPSADAEAARLKAEKEAADKAAADKKKPDEAAAAGTPAAGAPPVERVHKVKSGPDLPAAPAAGTETRTVEQIVREVTSTIKKEETPAPAAIDPEVQREIDLAAFAEKKNAERYAGMAAKVRTFYQQNDELLASKAKELGGPKAPEFKDWLESDDYKNWIAANRPSYQRGDRARLAEDLILDRGRAEARREMEPELKKLERQTLDLQHTPDIKGRTTQLVQQVILVDTAAEKDPALTEFTKNPAAFATAHPEEAQLIADQTAEGIQMIEETFRVDRNLVEFNPARPTPVQAKIRDFSVALNAELRAKYPNGFETADGKILVDAETYERHKLHDNPKYRTFTADEIAGSIASDQNRKVLDRLKKRRDGVSKSIYLPKTGAPATAPNGQAAAGEVEASPTAGVSATPGGKSSGGPEDPWKAARRKALSGK